MEPKDKKVDNAGAVKELENRRKNLKNEKERLTNAIEKDKKGKQKERNKKRIAEINNELKDIDEKLKLENMVKEKPERRVDIREPQDDGDTEQEMEILPHPNISIDRLREAMSNKDLVSPDDDDFESDNAGNESDTSLGPLVPHPNIDLTKDPEIQERLHPKCNFVHHPNISLDRIEKFKKCFEKEQTQKCTSKSENVCNKCLKPCKPCTPDISQKSCGSSKSQNICSSSSVKQPCDSVSAKTSCTSIATQKSLNQFPSYKSCSQSNLINQTPRPLQQKQQCASKNQSKVCINCGSSYTFIKPCSSTITTQADCNTQINSQPQNRSCKASMTSITSGKPSTSFGYYNDDHSRTFPTKSRSKCSQLSQKHSRTNSAKSFGGCQSFDECSTCNKIIFQTGPSCGSFDVCSRCKQSLGDCSQSSHHTQSGDLKARSVNFNACKEIEKTLDTDEDTQNEEILQKFDCQSTSKSQSFCGCKSALKCHEINECDEQKSDNCNVGCNEPVHFEPPKEPSQLTMMKNMLQDRIAACNMEQPIEEKPPIVIRKTFDPTKPRLHRTTRKKNEFDDLDCPINPCCLSSDRREKMEQVTNKLIEREGKRQKAIQLQREERMKRMQKDQCGDANECKVDPECCDSELADECVEYSKKYLKMKYEIELQNYLVEKLNRDLQMKMSREFPESALQELQCNLENEVNKLREMVNFTIFEQCRKKDLKWGPIPVSPLTFSRNFKNLSSSGVPKTPSGVSNISAFSMLEDLKLCQEKEQCERNVETQKNRQSNITEITKEIRMMECKMAQLECKHIHLTESLENLEADETEKFSACEKIQQLEDIRCKMERIVADIKETKDDIDKMHVKLHMIHSTT